jgi:hypothetical protein
MTSIFKLAFLWAIENLPAKQSLELQYFRHHHDFARLNHPRTFSEKILHRKLYRPNDKFHELADKVRVKKYVADTVGERFVIPTLWSGTSFPPVRERRWPTPFVVKVNHGSGWNIFVRTDADKDWAAIENECDQWLATSMPRYLHEDWYDQMEKQIMVEPMLGPPQGSLNDYKLFVFGGKTKFIQIDTDRSTDHKRVFYDSNWVRQPFSLKYPLEPRDIERPRHFDDMLQAAEKLGNAFDFVRIDFYDIDEGAKFGEMTFAPGSGYERFDPASYDRVFGDCWQ